jgi:NAD(P)-dependent dehydrogenase (short-subunit alcohol dehydrogenase family)
MTNAREVALVTGASRGLGLALSRTLARAGVEVAMVARDAELLEHVAAEIRRAGGKVATIADDVGDPAAALRIAAQTHALVGAPSLVVHNASTLGAVPLVTLAETEPEAFARTLATNVTGPFALTRALVGQMVLAGRGTIVHISSDAAVEAYPTWGAYGVSKAALDHLSRIWAAELDGTGVRVIALDPGEMATKMHADAAPDADPATLADPNEVAARIVGLLRAGAVPSGARIAVASLEEAA